jgi:hypothetical protein
MQAGLVEDQGGLNALSTARFIAIEGLTRQVFLRDLMDAQIIKMLREYPKAKHPHFLSKLYSYRAPIDRSICQYLTILGLEKREAPAQTLEEILNDQEAE